jgi:tetratricopeptide (TPR) repeat protein
LLQEKAAANTAWAAMDYDRCIESLEKAVDLQPTSDVLHRYRARACLRAGRGVQAIESASQALTIHPRGSDNNLVYARVMHKEHRLKEAATAYLRASRLGLAHGVNAPDLPPTSYLRRT